MIERRQLPDNLRFIAPVLVPDLLRMGKDWDGGYVISLRSVEEAVALLSFGVNDDWSFDQDWLHRKPNDIIHAYDGTIQPDHWDQDLQARYRKFFCGQAQHIALNVAANTSDRYRGFSDIMSYLNRQPVFIKMDIEGGEWDVTESIMSHSQFITGMVIEFHFTAHMRQQFCDTMRRYQERFHVIHIHPNTSCGYAKDNFPDVVEITFVNQNLWSGSVTKSECHRPDLDQPNLPDTADVALYWSLL